MALYIYQGFAHNGSKTNGSIDATSEAHARDLLQKKGVLPTSIVASHKMQTSKNFLSTLFAPKVSAKEKVIFTKQLAVLLRSSVPLLQAVELLIEQFSGELRTILISIKDGLKEGISFADGLRRYPHVFENIYVQLVRAGEASGKLEMILDRLVNYLEGREEMRKRISGALRGPLIQLALIFLVTIFLLTNVVPSLAGTFSSQGAQLPQMTQLLMTMSDIIMDHYILLTVLIGLCIGFFIYWKHTTVGSYTFDEFKLKAPIIGFFSRTNAVVQFCATLGMLLEGGVLLSEALDIVCNIIDNQVLKKALLEAREKIIKQGKMAQYLKQTNVFPPIATYLISTGEETGELDTMLLTVAANYEKELIERADNLSALIDPIMMIIMAVVVGFIVIAIALPMLNMGQAFGV